MTNDELIARAEAMDLSGKWLTDEFLVGGRPLIEDLIAALKASEARVKELEEALEPFSAEASLWLTLNYHSDDAPVDAFDGYEPVMTCGDLFRAREALIGTEPGDTCGRWAGGYVGETPIIQPCQGEMINKDGVTVCDTCGETK